MAVLPREAIYNLQEHAPNSGNIHVSCVGHARPHTLPFSRGRCQRSATRRRHPLQRCRPPAVMAGGGGSFSPPPPLFLFQKKILATLLVLLLNPQTPFPLAGGGGDKGIGHRTTTQLFPPPGFPKTG